MSGYDKFFKQAKQAKQGSATPRTQAKSQRHSSSQHSSPKFELSERRRTKPEITPEEQLRLVLADRMKQKKKQAVRRKQEFPVGAAVFTIVLLIGSGIGYFQPDFYEEILGKVEIGVLGKARAAGKEKASAPSESAAPAKPAGSASPNTAKSAAAPAKEKAAETPDVKSWSEEELSFFNKLNERKQELDLREAELAKLEEELQKQKAELDEKIKQLEGMRTQISQTLKSRVANDQQKVDKLVEFYSTMKPQQAAKIIETINEDLAVEVIDKMKKKSAAEIMNMLDAKKARRLSELLTGYER